jgi:glutamate synthase (NADPH/NADH) small chain
MGDAINISGLQAFACQYGRTNNLENMETVSANGKRVAVVGAGPAGMSCAAELAKKGYTVTMFEKDEVLGGVAAWGVPLFRLPAAAIDSAIAGLEGLNVECKFGKLVASVQGLLKEGYEAYLSAPV